MSEITFYGKGSWFDAVQLMEGDVVQVGDFRQPATPDNTLVVGTVVAYDGADNCLVEFTNGLVTEYDTGNRKCWVVGDTHERADDDECVIETDPDARGASESTPLVECDMLGNTYVDGVLTPALNVTSPYKELRSHVTATDEEEATYERKGEADGTDYVRPVPHVICEDPSERSVRLARGMLGGPSRLYPNLTGFGWDVTSTPKAPRDEYPNKARKVRQLIEQAERLIEITQ